LLQRCTWGGVTAEHRHSVKLQSVWCLKCCRWGLSGFIALCLKGSVALGWHCWA
jgi:hypothetical protein